MTVCPNQTSVGYHYDGGFAEYTIADAGSLATAAQLEIADHAGTVIAIVTGIPFAAGAQSAVWDGKINQGANNGQWIGPTASAIAND